MAKKPVKRDYERVVFFFEKKRKLDDNGEFKVGRMRVRVKPQGRSAKGYYAMLSGYDGGVLITVLGARSRAAALKQLERRLEMLRRTLNTICEDAGPLRGWNP